MTASAGKSKEIPDKGIVHIVRKLMLSYQCWQQDAPLTLGGIAFWTEAEVAPASMAGAFFVQESPWHSMAGWLDMSIPAWGSTELAETLDDID